MSKATQDAQVALGNAHQGKAGGQTIAALTYNLARAVAREEIERAQQQPAKARQQPAKSGVRVRVTEKAVEAVVPEIGTTYGSERYDTASRAVHAAAPHMQVMVDREMLEEALSVWDQQGIRTVDDFAGHLGLTITEGDTDD